ncbi:hypothetical protein [Amycolatopsis sp. NPDC051071]|uniref:hypothetical protein n=1 Tax=Amycolatopsis sp. NPDC051071 TaxID=3154637 RepID=UPI00343138E5
MATWGVKNVVAGVLVTVVAGLSAGCVGKVDTYEEGLGPKELPKAWPTENGHALRPVPMPTGEFLLALPPETTAQVLCQAVPAERWTQLMGGPVAREVEHGESCHAVGLDDWVRISVNRTAVTGGMGKAKAVTIAGRPATLVVGGAPSVVEVKLSDTDVRVLRIETSWTRVPRQDNKDEGLLLGLTESVLNGAFSPGPKLPAADKRDIIERKTVEPGAGILDAPLPEISWKLCTQLGRALGIPETDTEPYSDGKCTATTVDDSPVRVEHTAIRTELRDAPVAGRPAQETSGELSVLLTDNGSGQGLRFYWSGGSKTALRELAEKVVAPLLGS